MASPSATQATRRRQRSVRVSVATGLVVLAALVVAGAAVSGSWLLTTIAASLAVVLGAAAVRITHTELVESRVSAARDRAAQAKAYLELAEQRSAESEGYLDTLRVRLAEKEQCLDELEVALSLSQRRAATSTRRRNAEGRRAAELELRLADSEARTTVARTQLSETETAAANASAAAHLRIAELEQEVLALRAELNAVTAAWHSAEHQRKHA